MVKLHKKECKFYFNESCLKAFRELKEKLVSMPIIIFPDWIKPFKVMCDASGVALGVVLGQRRELCYDRKRASCSGICVRKILLLFAWYESRSAY